MKYNIGDRVRIKSLDWYNENKDELGNMDCGDALMTTEKSKFCGKIVTISNVSDVIEAYKIEEDDGCYNWTDEMIEGLVEEETKSKFKVGDKITNGKVTLTILTLVSDRYVVEDTFGECGTIYFNYQDGWKIVEEETNDCENCGLVRNSTRCLFTDNCPHNKQKNIIEIPKEYVLKDENGNVINARKIVLEKKKKEYPKTFEECCKILGLLNVDLCFNADYRSFNASKEQWKRLGLMNQFYQLLICRDAYWKLYGEEMGLGKPWEPDWNNVSDKYCIYFVSGYAWSKECQTRQCPFAFPTEEMRDAFYENFKDKIELCIELL